MRLRSIIAGVLSAHEEKCLGDCREHDALLDALVSAIVDSPEARLVREALGDREACFIGRVAGANGKDQHRLHVASNALAGGDAE